MKKEDWKELNEKSHYNSLKKQDIEHRKLIKKLQIEVRNLKEQSKLFGVGISLESREQKILALLLINHINNLDKSSMKKPELIEEYRERYYKLLDKINEV